MLLLLNTSVKIKIVTNCKILFNWTKSVIQLWVTGPLRKYSRYPDLSDTAINVLMMTSGRIVRKTKFRKREKILHSEKKFHVRKKKFRMRNIVFRTIRTI